MDLTSTSSLILFPMTSTQPRHESTDQYHELARQASGPLPASAQRQVVCQLPSARVASMQASVQTRRKQEREEMKRVQITSFRSKDGLLSPPPLPVYVRRKKKSIVGLNTRAMESSPELGSPSSSEFTESDRPSPPPTPPYSSRAYATTSTDLRIFTPHIESAGLGISGPKSAPVSRSYNASPRRPSPFRSHTMNDAVFGTGLIQPPSPSLLRPKSFWKNHPRSALTSLAWSPSSQVVRRSTFVAAGMNIDQGFWDGHFEAEQIDLPPRLPRKDGDSTEDEMDTDPEEARQHQALRAFGNSLWNASTLALAVESRNKGVGMPIVCVPGEY